MDSTAVKETTYKQDLTQLLSRPGQSEALKQLREDAFAYFTDNGFPAVKSEDWKYTNVAPIAKETWKVTPFPSDFSLESEKSE